MLQNKLSIIKKHFKIYYLLTSVINVKFAILVFVLVFVSVLVFLLVLVLVLVMASVLVLVSVFVFLMVLVLNLVLVLVYVLGFIFSIFWGGRYSFRVWFFCLLFVFFGVGDLGLDFPV